MEALSYLVQVFGLSFTSGVNLYATVALVGLAIRFQIVHNLPHQLDFLANEYVIGVAVVLYICEFIADKVPAFDTVWDGFHTFIRPFAAAAIALMAAADTPMYVKIIVVMVAGGVALTAHTAKSGVRLLVNTSPEPFSNSIISILEDVGVFLLIALILTHPVIAAIIVLILIIIIFWQGPKLFGFIIFLFKAFFYRLNSLIPSDKMNNLDSMPLKYDDYLNTLLNESEKTYLISAATFNRPVKASGFVIVTSQGILLMYKTFFTVRHTDFNFSDIKDIAFKSGFLTDKITFVYDGKKYTITLLKNNSRTLSDIESIISSIGKDLTGK